MSSSLLALFQYTAVTAPITTAAHWHLAGDTGPAVHEDHTGVDGMTHVRVQTEQQNDAFNEQQGLHQRLSKRAEGHNCTHDTTHRRQLKQTMYASLNTRYHTHQSPVDDQL